MTRALLALVLDHTSLAPQRIISEWIDETPKPDYVHFLQGLGRFGVDDIFDHAFIIRYLFSAVMLADLEALDVEAEIILSAPDILNQDHILIIFPAIS